MACNITVHKPLYTGFHKFIAKGVSFELDKCKNAQSWEVTVVFGGAWFVAVFVVVTVVVVVVVVVVVAIFLKEGK
jgi:hypothetical protein